MNDLHMLVPQAEAKARELIAVCEAHGYKIKITQTLRTKAEQDALYAQGRTKSGSIVTNVKYPNSMHCWGVAFDICRNDGTGAYNDADGFFTKVGQLGVSIGLEWGGNWKSIVDKPHFQLSQYGSTPTQLKKLYGTPQDFMDAQYVQSVINRCEVIKLKTVKRGSRGNDVKILQLIFNLDADGICGTQTVNAITAFQKANNLTADGICGVNTWKTILNTMMATV